MTQKVQSILDIQDHYDTYLVDMVGVIYDGVKPFQEAIEAINSLIEAGKQVIFISNNPRPSTIASSKLQKFGMRGPYHIVTSGDYMRHRLKTDLSGLVFYHLGAERNTDLLQDLSLKTTPSLELADAVILSIFLDQGDDTSLFGVQLQAIVKAGKPVYCPNPDRRALYGDDLRYTAGYFADKIRALGGKVIDIGKPSFEIYDFASQFMSGPPFNKNQILMIGDTLETDIQGAHNYGIDSLLVLSGIFGLSNSSNPVELLDQLIPNPTYVMSSLRI